MPVLRPPDRGNVEAGSGLLLDRLPRLGLSPAARSPSPEVDLDALVAGLRPEIAEVAPGAGIAVAARADWRAAAFLLSHRWPERWGRHDDRLLASQPTLDSP